MRGIIFLFSILGLLFADPASLYAQPRKVKILVYDKENNLIAIDLGSNQGLTEKERLYLNRGPEAVMEIELYRVNPDVSIAEIKSIKENVVIQEDQVWQIGPEVVGEEVVTSVSAPEISPPELAEAALKERARGIAEAVAREKEMELLKQRAREIAKQYGEEKKRQKHIVSFNFKNAAINQAIKIIGREARVNVLIPPDFPSLPITVTLNEVELENALALILGMVNYTFVKEKNIYKIVKLEEVERKTTHKYFSPQYIQVEKLKSLLTEGGLISSEGKVIVDSRSNKLMVIDLPANMQKIEEFISQVDVRPRQVTIEAKIIDVSLTDTEKLGIEWTWVKPRVSDAETDDTMKWGFTLDAASGLGKGFFRYGTLGAIEIATVLEALMKREQANILSKPTITTLNNEEAKINVTTKVAYQESTTTTPATGPVITTVTWLEKEVGVTLSVTPYITELGDIIMKVEPTASLLQGWTSDDPATRYPLIMTRSAATQVLVKDGDTLVIGGLITQELRDIKSGIPVLSDIPILGLPFQKKSKSLVNTELIIFITPHIVPSEEEQTKG